jgi:SNF2 family DNA or RNA helicase
VKPIHYRDHLILPADNRVAIMVPHVKVFTDPETGAPMMLVPHKLDETQVLRNLGYEVTPPVMMAYDFPHPVGQPPYDAQRITTALITTHKRSFVFNGLGTGKTRSALWAYDYLRRVSTGRRQALVVAPLTTMRQTWLREITTVFPHLKGEVLHGSKAKRLKLLAESDADVLIINHDGVETIYEALMAAAKEGRFILAVLDELSVYKNARTEMWKKTNKVMALIDRVTGMTGTPMPLAASDAYGQLKMINPTALGGDSFGRFREKVMTKLSEFRWINQRDAVERVHKMMQPSVRFTRDECYDMPPCQLLTREATLSDQARKMINMLQDQGAIESLNIKAANAADVINKCLQTALGVVYDMDHNEVEVDPGDRLQLLDEAIEQSASKVIVFTPYKSTLKRLVKHCEGKYSTAVVSGDVPNREREHIFTAFMQAHDPQVLLAHPECMSHGLTLTEASTIVWYGPPQSLETFEQANGRITRAGQKHSQLIMMLVATKLERKIFSLLRSRANVQQKLLELFESQDLGDLSE